MASHSFLIKSQLKLNKYLSYLPSSSAAGYIYIIYIIKNSGSGPRSEACADLRFDAGGRYCTAAGAAQTRPVPNDVTSDRAMLSLVASQFSR